MKNKQRLKLSLAIVMTIIALITILSGTCSKIAKTGFSLILINLDIRAMEEDQQSNTRLDCSESYQKDSEERAELYNSEDPIIRWYANLPGFLKAIILIIDLLLAVYVSLLFTVSVLESVYEHKKSIRKKLNNNAK